MEEDKEKLQERQEESSEGTTLRRTRVGFPQVQPKQPKSKKGLFVVLVIMAVVLGVGGWFIFGGRSEFFQTEEVSPTPVAEEPTSTPTEKPIEREGVKIQVLNGTGISGAAAELKEELEGIGYSQIEVGNASPQNRVAAEVTFDTNLASSIRAEITENLEQIYEDVSVEGKTLDEFDVEIVTGYPKGYTPTPTQKPKATSTPTPTSSVTGTVSPTTTVTPTLTPTPTPVP